MAASMGKIVGAVIAISVSVIVVATVLAPTIATYTADSAALASYADLLGAVIIMSIVGILMVAVALVTKGRD